MSDIAVTEGLAPPGHGWAVDVEWSNNALVIGDPGELAEALGYDPGEARRAHDAAQGSVEVWVRWADPARDGRPTPGEALKAAADHVEAQGRSVWRAGFVP